MAEYSCKNCGASTQASYCPECGQKQNIRITPKYVISVTLDALEIKKGLLYNLKGLILNPGGAVHEYLDGKTKPFLNPITFLLIALSAHMLEMSINMDSEKSFFQELYHQSGYTFILIITTLLPNYLIFKFKTYSCLEQLTASIIFSAYLLIVMSLVAFVRPYIGGEAAEQIIILVLLIYIFFSFQSILKRRLFRRLIDLLISLILAFICFFTLFYVLEPF